MEQREVEEFYEYLTENVRPHRLSGNKKKNAYKAFKKRAKGMWISEKDEKRELSIENSVFFTEKCGKVKIVLRKSQLEEVWERFHKDEKTGGHQGLWSMYNRIHGTYFVKDLRKWLAKKIEECPTCKIVQQRQEVPPSATLVPEKPRAAWQIDYIGSFPCDSKNNFQYALVGIDCFSKYTMVSGVYEQGSQHVWDSLERWFALNGKPEYIFCDNGGPFISECKLV
jgi:hypothetical protein